MKNTNGFTLLELLLTILILSIIVTIGIPSLSSLIESSRSQNIYNNLFTLIQYTRSRAAFLHEDVILCPSENTNTCINNWQKPIIIFVDKNKNRKRDEKELIDRVANLLKDQETITWRASATSRYLRYTSTGETGNQNGTFTICNKNKNMEYTKKIIIYRSGRARKGLTKEIKSNDCR